MSFVPVTVGVDTIRLIAQVTSLLPSVASQVSSRPADAMWRKDSGYSGSARAVDGRVCINEPVRKYDPAAACGADAQACLWKYIQVDKTCDALNYGNVLFQVDRYVWAQAQLAARIANQPGGGLEAGGNDTRYASAWVDWCIDVMRLVSLARWSTNIRPEYLPGVDEGPEAIRVAQASDQSRGSVPTKLDQADIVPVQNQFCRTLFRPSMKGVFQDSVFGGWGWGKGISFDNSLALSMPGRPEDFDPYMVVSAYGTKLYQASMHLLVSHGLGQSYWGTDYRLNGLPWPHRYAAVGGAPATGLGPNDTVQRRMQMWFEATLGMGYWLPSSMSHDIVQAIYHTGNRAAPSECTGGMSAGPCVRRSNVQFWWGAAPMQIAMCVAWAKDVVTTPFEAIVAHGLQGFIDAYAAIPDSLKVLDYESLTQLRSQVTVANFQNCTTAFMTVTGVIAAGATAVNPIAGAVIAAVGVLMQGVTEMLKALHLLAYGGGEVVGACIPPPVFRMIRSSDTEACNFNTADGQLPATVARATALQRAADAGLPVSVWHDLAQTASGETQSQPSPILTSLQPAAESSTWKWALLALGVGAGAIVVYKAVR